jgi:hypothetical protein
MGSSGRAGSSSSREKRGAPDLDVRTQVANEAVPPYFGAVYVEG